MPYPLPPYPLAFTKVSLNQRNSDEYLSWNQSVYGRSPHALVIGPSAPARSDVIERLLRYTSVRNIPTLVVKPEPGEKDSFAFPTITGPLTAARLMRALHEEFHARAQHIHNGSASVDEIPTLVLTIDGIGTCIRQWDEITAGDDEAAQALLTSLDPIRAFDDLLVLGRSAKIVLLVGAAGTEPFAHRHGQLRNLEIFGTRIGLGGLTHDDARAMFNDEIDASEIILEPTHALVGSVTGLKPALHFPSAKDVTDREQANPIFTAYSKAFTRFLVDQSFADVVEMN
ncbi:hypothetical protein ACIBM3_31220 [Rhodococcus erythropolis]|uniref:hypothetical protein n=1 Tax=Rhodococcus erythropolis TaxID=1833 RepID=UPI00378F373F